MAFADVDAGARTVTADRAEFLGRHGSVAAPAALGRVELSGRVGAVLDPCAAIQVKFDLDPGEAREVVFLLGEAGGLDEARDLVAPPPRAGPGREGARRGQGAAGTRSSAPSRSRRPTRRSTCC